VKVGLTIYTGENMKTEAIRYCIQARFGKEDYAEARLELTALETEINRLAAFNESMQTDARKNTETINKLKKALTDIRETYVVLGDTQGGWKAWRECCKIAGEALK
jgi:chromosome segregation ATPase